MDAKRTATPGIDGSEGRVGLRLRVAETRVAGVEFENRRALGLASALAGRAVDTLPELLGRLFPVCGSAHRIACERAIAAAGAIDPVASTAWQVDLLNAELSVAHAWRRRIDWPLLLDWPPEPAALRPVHNAAQRLRGLVLNRESTAENGADDDWRRAARLDLAAALETCIFAGAAPQDARDLVERVATSSGILAALLQAVAASALAGHDPPAGRLLSAPDADWFAARLTERPEFGWQPDLDGEPAELGAYADCTDADRVCYDPFGPVGARLLAMTGEVVHLLRRLRCEPLAPVAGTACSLPPDIGVGVAATVRGPLAYWLRRDGGRVTELRSVAPTEWMLHPGGLLPRLLVGLPAATAAVPARLAVAAFDPCAVLDISVEQPAHA